MKRLGIAFLIALSFTSCRDSAKDSNDACADHRGVRSINDNQGLAVCRDGMVVQYRD